MEFAVICLVAVILGLRGFQAGRRSYVWCAGVALLASLYTYHQH